MPNYCHECGGQVLEQAKFCGNCGKSIEVSDAPDSGSNPRAQSIEIIPHTRPSPMVIEQPVRYYEPVSGGTHHSQEFRDKTGFFDTFQQSLGSNFGGCLGQFMGCLVVLVLIFVVLAFLGGLAADSTDSGSSSNSQVQYEPEAETEAVSNAASITKAQYQDSAPEDKIEKYKRLGLSMMEEESFMNQPKPILKDDFWSLRFPMDNSILECVSLHSGNEFRIDSINNEALNVMRYVNGQRADDLRLILKKDRTGFSGDGDFGNYEFYPKENSSFLKVPESELLVTCVPAFI